VYEYNHDRSITQIGAWSSLHRCNGTLACPHGSLRFIAPPTYPTQTYQPTAQHIQSPTTPNRDNAQPSPLDPGPLQPLYHSPSSRRPGYPSHFYAPRTTSYPLPRDTNRSTRNATDASPFSLETQVQSRASHGIVCASCAWIAGSMRRKQWNTRLGGG
jgi:hypothetical protein